MSSKTIMKHTRKRLTYLNSTSTRFGIFLHTKKYPGGMSIHRINEPFPLKPSLVRMYVKQKSNYPILSYLSYSILIQHQKRALMISPFMAKLATNPKGFALSQQLSQGDYKWAPESHPLPWKINMFGSNVLFDSKHYMYFKANIYIFWISFFPWKCDKETLKIKIL